VTRPPQQCRGAHPLEASGARDDLPGDFVPLFEGNGLIGIVDSFVWQEAAKQVARWRDKYNVILPISVISQI
jgi:EAL domain-containing protein (putative c-di-GMP-specific phosphodiesterase class I)